jgi:hypothetical protein
MQRGKPPPEPSINRTSCSKPGAASDLNVMQQSESLLSIFAKKLFLGYALFSGMGLASIVGIVSASTSWEALLAGGIFIAFWGATFLVLQLSVLAIRVNPLRRFLRVAAVVSLVNLLVGVPVVALLFQTAYRWLK